MSRLSRAFTVAVQEFKKNTPEEQQKHADLLAKRILIEVVGPCPVWEPKRDPFALIKKGANVNYKDKKGTPLLQHVLNKGGLELAVALIERGADVNTANQHGNPALIVALAEPENYRNNGYYALKLIEKGADVNVVSKKGNSALKLALLNGYGDVAEALLSKGAAVDVTNKNSGSLLISALALKDKPAAQRIAWNLINKGVDINVSENGLTALVCAAWHRHSDIVKYLYGKGADFEAAIVQAKVSNFKPEILKNLEVYCQQFTGKSFISTGVLTELQQTVKDLTAEVKGLKGQKAPAVIAPAAETPKPPTL